MNAELLLETLVGLPAETEWVEFKQNNDAPDDIGEYISALANSAAVCGRDAGYLVWGLKMARINCLAPPFIRRRSGSAMRGWRTGWLIY